MIELQAYNSARIYWAVEQVEREAGDVDNLHLDDNLFYIKSEADKVIAEKNKEIKALKEHNRNYRFDNRNMLHKIMKQKDDLRRHKYKRCIAMAKYCDASMAYFGEFYDDASKRMADYYYNWRARWYKIAEKFKEAK